MEKIESKDGTIEGGAERKGEEPGENGLELGSTTREALLNIETAAQELERAEGLIRGYERAPVEEKILKSICQKGGKLVITAENEIIAESHLSIEEFNKIKNSLSGLESERAVLLEEQQRANDKNRENIKLEIEKIDQDLNRLQVLTREFEQKQQTKKQREEESKLRTEVLKQEGEVSVDRLLSEMADPSQLDTKIEELIQQRRESLDRKPPETPARKALEKLNAETEKLREEMEACQESGKTKDAEKIQIDLAKIEADRERLIVEKKVSDHEFYTEAHEELMSINNQQANLEREKVSVDRLLSEMADPSQLDTKIEELIQQRRESLDSRRPEAVEDKTIMRLEIEAERLGKELKGHQKNGRTKDIERIQTDLGKIQDDLGKLSKNRQSLDNDFSILRGEKIKRLSKDIDTLDDERILVGRLLTGIAEPGHEALREKIKRLSPQGIEEKRLEEQRLKDQKLEEKKLEEKRNLEAKIENFNSERKKLGESLFEANKWIVYKEKMLKEKKELFLRLNKKILGFDFNKNKREKILAEIKFLEESLEVFKKQAEETQQKIIDVDGEIEEARRQK